jgi:hypothetical protein
MTVARAEYPQIAVSDYDNLRLRSGLDYLGPYRTKNRRFSDALRWLSRAVVIPAEDYLLGWLIDKHYSGLEKERDNRSVTDPRWVEKGLDRYGCPIHATKSRLQSTAGHGFERARLSAVNSSSEASRSTYGSTSSVPFTVSGIGACSCRRGESSSDARRHGAVHRNWGFGYATERPRSDNGATNSSLSDIRRVASADGAPRAYADAFLRPWDSSAYLAAFTATRNATGHPETGSKPYSMDALVRDHIDPSAYSGAPFFTRNGDVLQAGVALAQRILEGKRGFDPYMGGRRVQPGNSGPKTRLIWMAPLPTTIVGGMFSKPIAQQLERKRPFSWGLHGVEKAALVSALQSRFRYVYSIDFSRFDSSVPATMIADAFKIVRSLLDLTEDEETVWQRYINDFIHSRLITETGEIFQKHKGIPSGSAFTSIIGSVVNLLVLNYAFMRVTGHTLKTDRVLVLGDDAIVASNSRPPLDELARACSELGFTLSVDKSQIADSCKESVDPYTNRVNFLGHYWVHGYPRRPIHEILLRMKYPERHKYRSREESLMRQFAYLADAREAWQIMRWSYPHQDTMLMLTHALDDIGANGVKVADYDLPGQLRLALKVSETHDLVVEPGKGLVLGITGLWRV